MIRSFVAIEVPESIRKGLAGLMRELERLGIDARFPRPEGMHLTLRFLGDVEEDDLPSIAEALAAVAQASSRFEVGVAGLGVFPHLANPRVVWTGIRSKDDSLALLQASVESALAPLGFTPEDREYRPHLTLARIRSRRRIALLMDFVEKRAVETDLGKFGVTEFHLFRSVLRPQGAEYSRLGTFELPVGGG